jgi:hypothetical protein
MRLAFGLPALAALLVCAGALAQSGPVPPGGFGKRGSTSPLIGPRDDRAGTKVTDPQAYDAISLFSRLCVSTRGNRGRAEGIVGNGDTSIEKMDPPLLRGLENGQSGGVGWIITMPLGDKVLLEFPPTGECVVRSPRADQPQLEAAFRNLLDQYASSGQFTVKREGEQSKLVDLQPDPNEAKSAQNSGVPKKPDKVKFNALVYSMTLPDEDRKAELALYSTQSTDVSIQATLTYVLVTGKP